MQIKYTSVTKHLALMLIFSIAFTQIALARKTPPHHRMKHKSPAIRLLKDKLVPPRLIMKHRRELELTSTQKETLKSLIKAYKAEEVNQQTKAQDLTEQLKKLLDDKNWDEQNILKQVQTIMDFEQKRKTRRLRLALKVRALLNSDQLQKAYEIKEQKIKHRKRRGKKRDRHEAAHED